MVHVGMADQDQVHPSPFLDSPQVRKLFRCSSLADPGIHQDSLIPCSYINAAAADFHGAARKIKFHMYSSLAH